MPSKSQIIEEVKSDLDSKISVLEQELLNYLLSERDMTENYTHKNGKRPFKEYICYQLQEIVKLKEQRKYLDSL